MKIISVSVYAVVPLPPPVGVATADLISSFSNLVNTPTKPEAQNATAIAMTIATATRITVATTGFIPALLRGIINYGDRASGFNGLCSRFFSEKIV